MTYGQVGRMKNRPRKEQSNGNSQNVKEESKKNGSLHLYLILHDDVLL